MVRYEEIRPLQSAERSRGQVARGLHCHHKGKWLWSATEIFAFAMQAIEGPVFPTRARLSVSHRQHCSEATLQLPAAATKAGVEGLPTSVWLSIGELAVDCLILQVRAKKSFRTAICQIACLSQRYCAGSSSSAVEGRIQSETASQVYGMPTHL